MQIILLCIGWLFLRPKTTVALMLARSHEINESQSQITASAKNATFWSLTWCCCTCRRSVCAHMYLADEAIPKGYSDAASPAHCQGQRAGCTVLAYASDYSFASTKGVCIPPATQQFGGANAKCINIIRGTLIWEAYPSVPALSDWSSCWPYVPCLPLESQDCNLANMTQWRGNRLYYL